MKSATIYFTKPTTSINFRRRIISLFSRIIFLTNYIQCHIELIMNNNEVIELDNMVININDKEMIKTFAILNENKIIKLSKKTKNINVKKVTLYYIESDEETFKNFRKTIGNFFESFNRLGKPFNQGCPALSETLTRT